jgi:multiple sugar transport system ATP-binding protein
MKDGVVQQFGSPQEIYDSPSNLFVAGFIGSPSMNFLKGVLVPHGAGSAFMLQHGEKATPLPLPSDIAAGLDAWQGREVILGIRPEHVTDAASARTGDGHDGYSPTEVSCEVELTEPTGPDTLVFANFNHARVTCRTHPRAAAMPGQRMTVAFDLSKAVLFDPNTEQRIS